MRTKTLETLIECKKFIELFSNTHPIGVILKKIDAALQASKTIKISELTLAEWRKLCDKYAGVDNCDACPMSFMWEDCPLFDGELIEKFDKEIEID